MRQFTLLIILFFVSVATKAQSQENVYNNSNTKNSNTNNQQISPAVQDTTTKIQYEEIQIQSKSVRSEKKAKSLKADQLEEAEKSELKDSNNSSQLLKTAQFQFETNYSNSKHQLYRRSPNNLEFSSMVKSANLYKEILPSSFEKHFYTYLISKYNPNQFNELEQAAKLNPTKTEVQQELAVFGIAVDNQELADSVTMQMITQNKITGGLLNYTSDLVNSIPANGTLLLHGYTELIPANYQRNTLGRDDIELISVDLMQSSAYQDRLEAKGFVMPNTTFVDTAFVQNFCALNTTKNIYLSMSFPKEYFQGMSSSLTTVGLTFAYNQTSLDYNAWNISLFEKVWKKHEMGVSKDQQSDALSANYLPTLISIARLYEEYNKTEEVKNTNQLILSVATRARKTGQLSKIKR
ncbi:hypothetical protein [Fluviicola taffensis]|uniref:Uncharacterized protein n=1 Tax=Fluviicola taffensis (strain DSM 16823 / NCIMB 13979 / RW262) TaxID=755732 RepID=F2IHU8_FLUTR|nr:hypothetical protein [Fluviicola taffensis]AEA45907.1 hypothetical protein Fluta_3943 [Fluviicola taffensis DSM 16823]